MICPCCKQFVETLPLTAVFDELRLGPVERRLADVLANRRGYWLSTEQLITLMYGNRRDGAPVTADSVLGVLFHHLRRKLKPFDIKFESSRGPGGGRRMAL